MAPLVAGWPETVCGSTVDRQCGSSMQACFNAAAAIGAGHLDLVVAAGVEMMSRVPMGSNGGDLSDVLLERWQIVPQGISAEVIADEWGLTREQLDAYSLESHRRAIRAADEGRFERELVPVELDGGGLLGAVDETPRRDTSLEALAALKPAFLPDGARHGRQLEPDLRRRGGGAARVRGAALAARPRAARPLRLLRARRRRPAPDAARQPAGLASARSRRAGLGWDDVAVIEVNEAFASVALQFMADTGLDERLEDVNPNGGGISLGHPLGATGARITATLLNELERRDARYGARDDVHRLRPGDRGRDRAPLTRWLLVRGRGDRSRSTRRCRPEEIGAHALVEAAVASSPASSRSSTRRSGRRSSASSRSPACPSTTRRASAGPGGSRSGRSPSSPTCTTRRRSRRPGSSRRASGATRTSGSTASTSRRRGSSSRRR